MLRFCNFIAFIRFCLSRDSGKSLFLASSPHSSFYLYTNFLNYKHVVYATPELFFFSFLFHSRRYSLRQLYSLCLNSKRRLHFLFLSTLFANHLITDLDNIVYLYSMPRTNVGRLTIFQNGIRSSDFFRRLKDTSSFTIPITMTI